MTVAHSVIGESKPGFGLSWHDERRTEKQREEEKAMVRTVKHLDPALPEPFTLCVSQVWELLGMGRGGAYQNRAE